MGRQEMRLILSADDDEDAHLLLRRAFEKAQIKAALKQVNGGAAAIAYLSGQGEYGDRSKFPWPDLLLLDLKMPGVNGFEVLEFLGTELAEHEFPVAVFSCSDNPIDVERARALGCDSYIVKPGDFKSLVELVKGFENQFLGSEVRRSAPATRRQARTAPAAASPTRGGGESAPKTASRPISLSGSPEIFSLLVEQVKDYGIFVLDCEGYVRSWNEGARRINGYEAHEIIGKHFSVFYPRADLDADKPEFELRMAVEMGRYEDEGWRLRKDGSRFWANVLITPLRDHSGTLSGFAKVTRDLTQRKMQEEHLQRLLESEERFRLLVEQVKDYAIFFLDARGNISSWNQGARRIKGYSADEIIGKHFSIFYTPEDLASEKPARELTIAIREGRYEEEGWRLKKDGSRFWASVVITALWDKRGNLSGFAKVTRDLTDRKREEEALRAKTLELGAFAHTLSHDLRAPLRSISSFAQVLIDERGELSPAEQDDYLQKIHRAAQSMDVLMRDILKLTEVSLAPAAEDLVPLEGVITEALQMLEADIKNSRAVIQVEPSLPAIKANRTLMLQIFTNLIANALKFTRPGQPARVEVFARTREFDCEIHVKDSGPGIPGRIQRSIFNMFDRGVANPASSGTGIGLAIVKRAAERAGGSVTVVSKEGEGSDFIVTLPCAKEVPSEPVGN